MKADKLKNINQNRPKFGTSWVSQQVGHKLQKCLNTAKCEIISLENRRGSLDLKNGNLYSDNQGVLKRTYDNSLSEHKFLGNGTFKRLYRKGGRLKVNEQPPYLCAWLWYSYFC